MAKKCTKKILDARAELLFNKTNCFFAVLVAVAVAVAVAVIFKTLRFATA